MTDKIDDRLAHPDGTYFDHAIPELPVTTDNIIDVLNELGFEGGGNNSPHIDNFARTAINALADRMNDFEDEPDSPHIDNFARTALNALADRLNDLHHTSITNINLKSTGNANEYTVEISWLDADDNPQTATDATPITITGVELSDEVAFDLAQNGAAGIGNAASRYDHKHRLPHAEDIVIADAGDVFTAQNVEDVLAELANNAGADLSDTLPRPLATVGSAGTSEEGSRGDHSHTRPGAHQLNIVDARGKFDSDFIEGALEELTDDIEAIDVGLADVSFEPHDAETNDRLEVNIIDDKPPTVFDAALILMGGDSNGAVKLTDINIVTDATHKLDADDVTNRDLLDSEVAMIQSKIATTVKTSEPVIVGIRDCGFAFDANAGNSSVCTMTDSPLLAGESIGVVVEFNTPTQLNTAEVTALHAGSNTHELAVIFLRDTTGSWILHAQEAPFAVNAANGTFGGATDYPVTTAEIVAKVGGEVYPIEHPSQSGGGDSQADVSFAPHDTANNERLEVDAITPSDPLFDRILVTLGRNSENRGAHLVDSNVITNSGDRLTQNDVTQVSPTNDERNMVRDAGGVATVLGAPLTTNSKRVFDGDHGSTSYFAFDVSEAENVSSAVAWDIDTPTKLSKADFVIYFSRNRTYKNASIWLRTTEGDWIEHFHTKDVEVRSNRNSATFGGDIVVPQIHFDLFAKVNDTRLSLKEEVVNADRISVEFSEQPATNPKIKAVMLIMSGNSQTPSTTVVHSNVIDINGHRIDDTEVTPRVPTDDEKLEFVSQHGITGTILDGSIGVNGASALRAFDTTDDNSNTYQQGNVTDVNARTDARVTVYDLNTPVELASASFVPFYGATRAVFLAGIALQKEDGEWFILKEPARVEVIDGDIDASWFGAETPTPEAGDTTVELSAVLDGVKYPVSAPPVAGALPQIVRSGQTPRYTLSGSGSKTVSLVNQPLDELPSLIMVTLQAEGASAIEKCFIAVDHNTVTLDRFKIKYKTTGSVSGVRINWMMLR